MSISLAGRACRMAAVVIFAALSVQGWAEEKIGFQTILDKNSPALVTLKYTLKLSAPGGEEQETPTEITGLMISADGLILCSNAQLGGQFGMMVAMMGARGREVRLTPKDIKVLIGADTQGVDAKLLTRDRDADLAWIRISDAKDKKFEFIDFTKSSTPQLGDDLLCIKRLSKEFDRTPIVSEGRLGGSVKKPRNYLVPSRSIGGGGPAALGLPIFASGGGIIGMTVMHAPEGGVDDDDEMGMMNAMMGSADSGTGMILPAAEIVKATARAQESAKKEE